MVTSALSAPGWRLRIAPLVLLATLMMGSRASAYSVLTHEATIDAAWDTSIKPLLLARFPKTSAAALDDARAYAYGGCVIHDLGYYPFGSKFFSNLVHYVRSCDFVESLIKNATDVNEYAFGRPLLPAALRADLIKHFGRNDPRLSESPAGRRPTSPR